MGLFDWLRQGSPPAGPPPFSVPAHGVVAEWNVTDGVGRVEIADGTRLRFGRACCVHFEPVEGVEVDVEAVEPHPLGGWRASRIVATSVKQVDELLEARDAERGVRGSLHLEPEEALALAHEVGLVTVTLGEPVASRVTLRAVFARAGAPGELDFAPNPIVKIGTHTFPLTVSDSPERSRVTLCQGPFAFRREAATVSRLPGEPFDTWEGWGLREATRLALAFAAIGQSVTIHSAGDTVFTATEWVRLLGDLDNPQCRPFQAFLGLVSPSDSGSLETRGMQVWALPDVVARGTDRAAHDACLVACCAMVHAAAPLSHSRLFVPAGVSVGPYPLDFDPGAPAPGATGWSVESADEQRLVLVPSPGS